ncbi:hypothetical protein ACOME3_004862 [Neoechinorhynchus agilis]
MNKNFTSIDYSNPAGDGCIVQFVQKTKQVTLSVYGMSCASCVASLERALLKVPGIEKVNVSLMASQAKIDYDESKLNIKDIAGHIEEVGFEVAVDNGDGEETGTVAKLGNMMLQIEPFRKSERSAHDVLEQINGVLDIVQQPFPNTSHYKCGYDQQKTGIRRIMKKLIDEGYKSLIVPVDNRYERMKLGEAKEVEKWRTAFATSTLFGLPSMIAMFVFMFAVGHSNIPMIISGLGIDNVIMFALACPVQYLVFRYFFKRAYGSVVHTKSANMDVLVCMATSIAFVYSVVDVGLSVILANFASRPSLNPITFFDVIPMLVMFVSLGRWLENMAKGKTSEALTKLMSLQPTDGIVLVPREQLNFSGVSCSESREIEHSINGTIYYECTLNADLFELGDLVKVRISSKLVL